MAKATMSVGRTARAFIAFFLPVLLGIAAAPLAACFSGSTSNPLTIPSSPDSSVAADDTADAESIPNDAPLARVAPTDAGPPDVMADGPVGTFAVGGNVIGLTGTGLVLSNGTDTVTVNGNGPFALPAKVPAGGAFDIEVQANPTGPAQTCTVNGGMGAVVGAAVSSVVVNCATNAYVVGGTVTGLAGTGLTLVSGSDSVAITATGGFAFATPVASGGAYDVTIGTQPTTPSQTCTVTAGSGTIASANVTAITVACTTNSYLVGGTVTGLAGAGLTLALEDGTGAPLAVAAVGASPGTFSFTTPIASGAGYTVLVQAQPTGPTQACRVTAGATGTITSADAVVSVACQTAAFTVGGTITGLAGSGLVLSDNGGDLVTLGPGATAFTFATSILSGAAFDVEVATSPSGPVQSCSVAGNVGTVGSGAVTSVSVDCSTSAFGISGAVSNLVGSGLQLSDGTDTLAVTSGTFSFPALPSATAYLIKVTQQPSGPSQTCTVSAGASGTVGSSAVTGVTLDCATATFPVSLTVSGLVGAQTPLTVSDGVDSVDVFANGMSTLPTALASGTSYALTITQPTLPWQTCAVTTANGAGTVTNTPIAIGIACTTNTSALVATVTGLIPPRTALQIDDGVETLSVSASGKASFTEAIASGDSYAITLTNPAGPAQTCVVTSKNATGTVTSGGPVDIDIACSWAVTVEVWGQSADCGVFTLSDGTGQTCDVTPTRGGEQACVFDYSASAMFSIASGQVLNAKTGGLCACFQSDSNASTTLPELPFVNGTDGDMGFVFASGSKTGVATVYAYCQ